MSVQTKADVVIHPTRLRIIGALGGAHMTARELANELPDIPPASLYRHLKLLVKGGIFRVVEERVINGIVERTYAMPAGAAHFPREEFASFTVEQHSHYFSTLIGLMRTELQTYLHSPGFDTTRDAMTYFVATLVLDDEQARQFREDVLALIRRYEDMPVKGKGRKRTFGGAFIPSPEGK